MKHFKSLLSFSLVLSMIVGISSCGKYEEGPAISLRSKKARVANEWKVDKATDEDGNDVTENFESTTFTYEKDGSFKTTTSFLGATFSLEGEWSFTDNKEGIQTTYSYDFGGGSQTVTTTATILKLKEKEMWTVDDSSKVEVHYVPN